MTNLKWHDYFYDELKFKIVEKHLKDNSFGYQQYLESGERIVKPFEDKYYVYQNYCSNIFDDPKEVGKFLADNLRDMDEVIDAEAPHRIEDLEGYDIVSFDKLGSMEIGQPFYKVIGINSRVDMMTVLIGAPLYDTEYVKYWSLMRAGYMPVGI